MSAQPENASSPTLRLAGPPDSPPTDSVVEPEVPTEANDEIQAEPEFTGARLRELREARGLSINEISDRTRISRTVLLALEEERYEDMPNARVYVRGFVRCVARELDLDMDAVSQSYVPRWERWFADQPSP